MTLQLRRHLSGTLALASLVFVAVLLAHEHFNGGVRSHHLLDRRDLPTISNWFGVTVLPLLGWLLGVRMRNQLISSDRSRLPKAVGIGLVCSLLYGAVFATSFVVGASTIATGLFLGLFLLAAALPAYRIECIFGFVVGMAFTFGAVLPALVAVVVAAVSVLVPFAFRAAMSAIRPRVGPSEATQRK